MKPLIQKLPRSDETSFVAKTFATPHFEVGWHQHIEYELIYFVKGHGLGFIGNHVGEFKTGDVFFIGSNVPHTFQKQDKRIKAGAVVVQFTDDFWGKDFLGIPESRVLKDLFAMSAMGVQIEGKSKAILGEAIQDLERARGLSRISLLLHCLQLIIQERKKKLLSTRQMNTGNEKSKQRLDAVFQFTITHFQQPIALPQIARLANMSVTAFCRYFKTSTKKSYVEFLNEIRIGYACKLLQDTDNSIIDICYESGFNTAVNFNKQFFKVKRLTPREYRKKFLMV